MPIGSVSAGINHRKIRTLPRPAHFELGEADGAHYQTALCRLASLAEDWRQREKI
jgi:hypothetical protein